MGKLKKKIALLAAASMMTVSMTGGVFVNAAESEETELSILVMFDPVTGGKWRIDAFQEAADNLGYKINVERVDDATYKTKIRVMLQANELPDLFYTWGGSYSIPFLEADTLLPLENYIEDSGYNLDAIYKQTDSEGHIYTVPTTALESYCLFYNKEVFEQLGKDVPTNWDELLDVVEACNEAGIGALGLGNKDRWEGDLFYNMMVVREDADAFAKAVSGEGSFTDDAFLNAAEKVQTLVDMGAFQKGYMQATTSECTELLKAGKIAMYPCGSWNVTVYQEEDNLGCSVFPKTGEEDAYLSCCSNAADSGIVVNANSDNAERAAKLAVEYSKVLNDHLVEEGAQAYFETDVQLESESSEMMETYIENFNKLEKTQLWWYTYLDTAIGEPMRDLSHQQFAGKIEPESFVKELESIING